MTARETMRARASLRAAMPGMALVAMLVVGLPVAHAGSGNGNGNNNVGNNNGNGNFGNNNGNGNFGSGNGNGNCGDNFGNRMVGDARGNGNCDNEQSARRSIVPPCAYGARGMVSAPPCSSGPEWDPLRGAAPTQN